jgi:hypothetical protein
MYLTQIAKEIVTGINAAPSNTWKSGGYSVPTDLEASFAFDPFSNAGKPGLNIYVVPYYIEYKLEGVRKVKHTHNRKYVTVALCLKVKVTSAPENDLVTEAEGTKILDLKEDLDNFLSTFAIPGITLKDMESEPLDDLKIQDSYFIAATVLGYDSC